MKKIVSTLFCTLLLLVTAQAQFSAGNVAVLRVGNGTEAFSNLGNSVFIDQYTSAIGQVAPVNSVVVPNSGANALIMAANSTSEGNLKLSGDGAFLTFGGYNANVGGSVKIGETTATSVNRAVGQVSLAGTYSQPYKTSAAFGGTTGTSGQLRGVVSDGNNYWGGGPAATGFGGTYYFGSAAAASIENGPGVRDLNIFGGNLYYSVASSTYGFGVKNLGALPTAGPVSSSMFLNVAGIGTGSASPYDFSFNPNMTLAYVADDRSVANGGGIQRWEWNGLAWVYKYTFTAISAGSGGGTFTARQLAVDWSGANPIIYATTTATSNNKLIDIVDSGSGALADVLGASGANMAFRGVAFIPVPEPATGVLLGIGLLLCCSRFRRTR